MTQSWFCEKCEVYGLVRVPDHADVVTVVHAIEDDHARRAPRCDNPVTRIRMEVR